MTRHSNATVAPDAATARSRSRQAYEHIQRGILGGRLPPGSVVSESALARELGISRTPVGEAIRLLASEGLVRQVPRYGTIVRALDRRDLVEQYEMREALEGYAAAAAATRITPEALGRLTQLCDAMRGIGHQLRAAGLAELADGMLHRFLAADMAFHMVVIESAGNRRILDAVQAVRALSRIFRTPRMRHDAAIVERAEASHRRIVAALDARDADRARRAMGEHIAQSKRQALERMSDGAAGEQPGGAAARLSAEFLADLDQIEQGGRVAV